MKKLDEVLDSAKLRVIGLSPNNITRTQSVLQDIIHAIELLSDEVANNKKMINQKLQFILSHLLWSRVKFNDAPASADTHFDMAIVELSNLIENYQPQDDECKQALTDAKLHINLYKQKT